MEGCLPLALSMIGDKKTVEFIKLCLTDRTQRPSAAQLLNHPYLQHIDSDSNNKIVPILSYKELRKLLESREERIPQKLLELTIDMEDPMNFFNKTPQIETTNKRVEEKEDIQSLDNPFDFTKKKRKNQIMSDNPFIKGSYLKENIFDNLKNDTFSNGKYDNIFVRYEEKDKRDSLDNRPGTPIFPYTQNFDLPDENNSKDPHQTRPKSNRSSTDLFDNILRGVEKNIQRENNPFHPEKNPFLEKKQHDYIQDIDPWKDGDEHSQRTNKEQFWNKLKTSNQ